MRFKCCRVEDLHDVRAANRCRGKCFALKAWQGIRALRKMLDVHELARHGRVQAQVLGAAAVASKVRPVDAGNSLLLLAYTRCRQHPPRPPVTTPLAQCRATLAAERVERDCEARKQRRELARPVTDNGATAAVVARCNRGRVRAFTGSAAFFLRAALAA